MATLWSKAIKIVQRARETPPTQRDSWATDTATHQKRKPAESLRDPTRPA
jgi:hypothetical protein